MSPGPEGEQGAEQAGETPPKDEPQPESDSSSASLEGAKDTARSAFLEGAKDTAPMMLAVGPFGAVAGLAAVGSGLTFAEAVSLSVFVNAGAAQLAGLALITNGAPIPVILATVFFVNLRFLMYSVALAPYLSGVPRGWRLLMAHFLVDQTFAFASQRYSQRPHAGHRVAYFFGLVVPLVTTWLAGTVVGAVFGAQVPEFWSLEFAIPLTFLALLMPAIADRPAALAALIGGTVALLGIPLPYNLGLIAGAFSGIAAGLLSETRWRL